MADDDTIEAEENAIAVISGGPMDLPERLRDLFDLAWAYRAAAVSRATRSAYESDWRQWSDFCGDHGIVPLPAHPMCLVAWIGHMIRSVAAPSTISRRLSGIRHHHYLAGHLDPTSHRQVREILAGYSRDSEHVIDDATPISEAMLHQMVDALGEGMRPTRDRALLLCGWYGCFRRGELAALQSSWLERTDAGYTVRLRGTKTGDQTKGIPYRGGGYCPTTAMVDWLRAADVKSGPVFRTVGRWGVVRPRGIQGRTVARVVKEVLEAAGYDPAPYSAHSLRAGSATAAAKAGASVYELKLLGGWATSDMPMHYAKATEVLENHPFRRST